MTDGWWGRVVQTGKTAAWAGSSAALALVALPLFLIASVGSDAVTAGCASAATQTQAGHAAGADSRTTAGQAHIDLPLAQADVPPPVPPSSLTAAPWTYPVPAPATVTARFGQSGSHWVRGHTGIDFAPPAGTPVFATTDGVVLAVVPASAGHPFGTFVTVLHADNIVTVYAHLSAATPTRGQQVSTGDPIGKVGSTGNSTGPHLHFEVRPQIGGRHLPVNPEPYLSTALVPAAGPAPAALTVSAVDCFVPTGGGVQLPHLAQQMTPTIRRLVADCPQLPPAWVQAQVAAESSWNPGAWSTDSNGGAAGLYQLNRAAWQSVEGAAGSWAPGRKPPPGHPVWEPGTHLRVGVTFTCRNLRQMTAHLAAHPSKKIRPLDAMAVCHVAGCSRVTHSTTGIPTPGEAGCGPKCVNTIHAYLNNIHRHLPAA
ncbi:peptidoglycan DD-metalloendopeptidase family protein [Streptomyces sp. 549]|uniref:M23 family metallopeptidase n=1 Tax=Streptomyces sp. 549 TaxID=3049076 RepID=UPI0024C43511|nr:peptidoglycan DD-metalloendopeptidase family protein [Streptomyces sp. 549]MDK1476834.1 peptidoglycan DD-metalloendopeptidase family protein [Streptomyces sp. 549]